MSKFLTIKSDGSNTTIIKKSRFIANFKKVNHEQEAIDFIAEIKQKYRDANHNCSAYVIGDNSEIKRAHDDGEPSGTAGIPMLEALENMNLKDVCVVVTRYFGGIKLGSGGLIRAYSHAVTDGVKEIGIVERVELQKLRLNFAYDKLSIVENYLQNHNLAIADKEFLTAVSVTILVKMDRTTEIIDELTNLLRGKITITPEGNVFAEVAFNQET